MTPSIFYFCKTSWSRRPLGITIYSVKPSAKGEILINFLASSRSTPRSVVTWKRMVPPMTLDVRRSFSFLSFLEYILTINQMPELLSVLEGYTLRADAALKVLTPDGLPVKIWPITYAAVGSV